MGIIGVVAALTLPALIANYKKQVTVTQLKKMYSVLSQTMLYTIEKDGDYSSLDIKDHDQSSINNWYLTSIKPYIKVTQECFDTSGCRAEEGTKLMNGGQPGWYRGAIGLGTNIVVFNTTDGYSVIVDAYEDNGNYRGVNLPNQEYVAVYIDVNGKRDRT